SLVSMAVSQSLSIFLVLLIGISFVNSLSFYVGTSGGDGVNGFSDAEYLRLRAVCKNYIKDTQKRSGSASPQIAQICKNVMKRSDTSKPSKRSSLRSLFEPVYGLPEY
ncbi:hypothetical protein PFISCL1PPCAC_14811, partial [Pristionchus fissidentatus]